MIYLYDEHITHMDIDVDCYMIVDVNQEPHLWEADILDFMITSSRDWNDREVEFTDEQKEIIQEIIEEKIQADIPEIVEYGKLTTARRFEDI